MGKFRVLSKQIVSGNMHRVLWGPKEGRSFYCRGKEAGKVSPLSELNLERTRKSLLEGGVYWGRGGSPGRTKPERQHSDSKLLETSTVWYSWRAGTRGTLVSQGCRLGGRLILEGP